MPVRVYDPAIKCEYTAAVQPDDTELLDKPALDVNGRWLPAKFRSPLGKSKGKADHPATGDTEANEEAMK